MKTSIKASIYFF